MHHCLEDCIPAGVGERTRRKIEKHNTEWEAVRIRTLRIERHDLSMPVAYCREGDSIISVVMRNIRGERDESTSRFVIVRVRFGAVIIDNLTFDVVLLESPEVLWVEPRVNVAVNVELLFEGVEVGMKAGPADPGGVLVLRGAVEV